MGYYEVVTDGKVFRITFRRHGGEPAFICNLATGKAREFSTKEAAEAVIHDELSMSGWKKA